jgi:hypothetical protein
MGGNEHDDPGGNKKTLPLLEAFLRVASYFMAG